MNFTFLAFYFNFYPFPNAGKAPSLISHSLQSRSPKAKIFHQSFQSPKERS